MGPGTADLVPATAELNLWAGELQELLLLLLELRVTESLMSMEISTVAASGFLITWLNGHNYATWSRKVSLLLKREGLWNVVVNPPDLAVLNEEDDAELIQTYQRENKRALCLIGLTLKADCEAYSV